MQPIWCNVAVLAVVLLYYVYRAHRQVYSRKERILRYRVAYMLWVAADRADHYGPSVSAN